MLLITGGAGYIGSHAVINFLEAGYDILIFDNLGVGHIEIINTLKKIGNVKFEKGDLRNLADVQKLFNNYKIDGVIHFAAHALVGESMVKPDKYYENNVVGTLNLLNTMIKNDVKKIVFSSTCATYGEPNYVPIDENHPQNPINPYGTSKLMVEKILDDYDKAYDLKSIKLRYFNVVGADSKCRIGEWHDNETHLVPNILKSVLQESKEFKIFGDDYNTKDGTCVRDYINVEDLAYAHRLAYEYLLKKNQSDVFNLGTQNGVSVKEVFETCQKVLNKKIRYKIENRRAGDPAMLYADTSKICQILNWKPNRTLKHSIKTSYEWEKKNEQRK